MDKEERQELLDNLHLEDLLIVKYHEAVLRKKPKKPRMLEGRFCGMDGSCIYVCPEGKIIFQRVPYYSIMRLKNSSTGYDSGELHE